MASHFTHIKAKVFRVPQSPKTSSPLPVLSTSVASCRSTLPTSPLPTHGLPSGSSFLLLSHAKGVPNPFPLPRNLFPNVSASLTSLLRCLLRCQFSVRIFLTTPLKLHDHTGSSSTLPPIYPALSQDSYQYLKCCGFSYQGSLPSVSLSPESIHSREDKFPPPLSNMQKNGIDVDDAQFTSVCKMNTCILHVF